MADFALPVENIVDGSFLRRDFIWACRCFIAEHVRPRSSSQRAAFDADVFTQTGAARELVDEAVALAQLAPSNSNIQPWHVVFVSGPPRDRLVAAMLEEAKRRAPNIPPLPESFQHYRRELGVQVYGAMGIPIDDKAGHLAAVMRNWSSSARRWAVLSACIGTLVLRTHSAWECFCKRCCWL